MKKTPLRMLQPGEQMDLIPPAEQDAHWHLTIKAGQFYCPHCRDYEYEEPGVKRYHPELDPDGTQAQLYPHWAEKGWLAWFSCDNCAWTRFKPVTLRTVQKWGRELGGWKKRVIPDPNDPNEQRRQQEMGEAQRPLAGLMDRIFGPPRSTLK